METRTVVADPSVAEDEINLLDLAATMLRRKRLILAGTLAAAGIAVAVSILSLLLPPRLWFLPNVYTPRAVLLISEDTGGGLSGALSASGLSGLASLAGLSVGGSSNGELAVLIATSDSTVDELNAEFGFTARYLVKKYVKAQTRKEFSKRFSAVYDEKTRTVSLSFEDYDPEYAARVLNRTVEILDRRFASLGGNKALEQKRLLETKLADVQVAITRIEDEIQKFTARYGVLNIEALAAEQVTVLARLRSELILKDMEIENYQKFSRIDDPVVRRLRSERDGIQSKISELEKGTGGILPSQRQLPALAFEFTALQRDLMIQTEIFKILTQQYELAKFNAEGQEPAFQILEMADVPDKKSGPSRSVICVVAAMAGFFLSVLAAFVLEAISNIRKDPEAMSKLRGGEA